METFGKTDTELYALKMQRGRRHRLLCVKHVNNYSTLQNMLSLSGMQTPRWQRGGVTNLEKGSTIFELGLGRCVDICPDGDKGEKT